jgi:hypothetical protein
MQGAARPAQSPRWYIEIVANMQAQNLLKAGNTVTIVPFGQLVADAKTVVGDISYQSSSSKKGA